MPTGLVEQQDGVRASCDLRADQLQVLGHGVRVAIGHYQTGALALRRTDGTEDISPFRALVMRRPGAGSAPGPTTGDLVLLAEARFILKPDLNRRPTVFYADRSDDIGEVFLKASMASSSWA